MESQTDYQLAKNIIEVETKKSLSYEKIAKLLTAYAIKTSKGGKWTATQVRRIAIREGFNS